MKFEVKNPKFTKGPWVVSEGVRDTFNLPQYQKRDRTYVVLDEKRLPIAEIRMGNPPANAQLIAAAPEMFDILNALVLLGKIDERHPSYADVIAVIKKARGDI